MWDYVVAHQLGRILLGPTADLAGEFIPGQSRPSQPEPFLRVVPFPVRLLLVSLLVPQLFGIVSLDPWWFTLEQWRQGLQTWHVVCLTIVGDNRSYHANRLLTAFRMSGIFLS